MTDTPEFSHPMLIDQIGPAWQTVKLRADEAACRRLAERFEILSLSGFEATLRLRTIRAGSYVEVSGDISARAEQACVVTLEPVPEEVSDHFRVILGPVGEARRLAEVDVSFGEDDPEPLDGNEIDLGEIAAQHLSLALEPYPRSPNAPMLDDPGELPDERPEGKLSALGDLISRKPR